MYKKIPQIIKEAESNLRLDRNFLFQITNFRKYGKEEEKLLKDLIVFISLKYQKDLFGYTALDLDLFCKTMKYKRNSLLATHNDPLFFKINNQLTKEEHLKKEKENGKNSKYRVWKNKIENALLILQHEKFYFSEETQTIDIEKVSHKNFTYFKEVTVLFKKTARNTKLTYQYISTEEFENRLKKYFITTNLNSYLSLKKKNLVDLYFNILYRKQITSSVSFDFKSLAELMNVSVEKIEEENGFRRIKDNLKRKFNKIFVPNTQEEIKGINLSFVKGKNSKYYNVPIISWEKINIKEVELVKNKIYNDVFYNTIIKELSVNYYDNYQTHELNQEIINKGFLIWLFSNKDYEIKKSKYISVFADIRGNEKNAKNDAFDFFNKLANLGTYSIKEKFMFYKNNTYSYIINSVGKKEISEIFTDIKPFLISVVNHYEIIYNYFEGSGGFKDKDKVKLKKAPKFLIPKR